MKFLGRLRRFFEGIIIDREADRRKRMLIAPVDQHAMNALERTERLTEGALAILTDADREQAKQKSHALVNDVFDQLSKGEDREFK